jgi:hypothetical protein
MNSRWKAAGSVALLGTVLVGGLAQAQVNVSYGRITAVRQVDIQNQGAQAAGTLVGGALGVASGSGQSRSNRALRGLGGAAVGSRVAGAAGSTTGFEYTVLIGRPGADTGGGSGPCGGPGRSERLPAGQGAAAERLDRRGVRPGRAPHAPAVW